ncbi:helix-turn-helix domain-containing protein [Gordonibacter sp.]|uniref:helix-turn-helix domain-containing protein n=1 Tax=Gordonibacter sp. TaxID=1968902 RepID=UPI002FC7F6D7
MIHDQIREYLDSNEIKQKFLVERTGMSKQAVSSSLNGNRRIGVEEYREICRAFGVSLDTFAWDDVDLIADRKAE